MAGFGLNLRYFSGLAQLSVIYGLDEDDEVGEDDIARLEPSLQYFSHLIVVPVFFKHKIF